MGALSHLRVLDLSRVLAGPWCSQILGDLGADVIKIERPEQGDDTRSWGPPWIEDPAWGDIKQSAYFASANRNKRSIAVDLASAEGQKLVLELAGQCDILIENFKVGGLRAYGLDQESLRKRYPRLVYCSITGFGQTGPYAERPGYDFLIQGMGGLMSITGRPDADVGGGPVKVGVALTDIMTGLYATVGILAALAHRDRTGEGQYVDVSLLDVQVAALANQAMNYLASGKQPERLGNAHPNIVPYQDLPTRDGYVIVTVGNDAQFRRFCLALGNPEWANDPRFSTNTARIKARDELISLISARTRELDSAYWLSVLNEAGVPCGPINGIADVFNDPQVLHRGMKVRIPDTHGDDISMVGNPLRLSTTPVQYHRAPPVLGADTDQVLGSILSLPKELIQELRKKKVII